MCARIVRGWQPALQGCAFTSCPGGRCWCGHLAIFLASIAGLGLNVRHCDFIASVTKSIIVCSIAHACTRRSLLMIMVDGARHIHNSMPCAPVGKDRAYDVEFDGLTFARAALAL